MTPLQTLRKPRSAAALIVSSFLQLATVALAAAPAKRQFNVPAGDAEKSIKVFSEQARLEVLFPTDLVANVRTKSVSGELTPREALSLMLAGTDLIAVQDGNSGALSVRRETASSAKKAVAAEAPRAPQLPTSTAVSSAATDKVIELSPFVVSTASDRGYLATNTLSGTRHSKAQSGLPPDRRGNSPAPMSKSPFRRRRRVGFD